MAAKPDLVRFVDAAFSAEPDEATWLRAVVKTLERYEVGAGVVGYLVHTTATNTVVTSVEGSASAADKRAFRDVITSFTPAFARIALAPTEFVGNSAHRLERIARGGTGELAVAARASLARMPTLWALICGDVTSSALVLCFPRHTPSTPDDAFPHADSRLLGLTGAHVAAALRLRALTLPKLGDAARSRESLSQAVLESEVVRRGARTAKAEEAQREWTALVHGRWTVMETIERGGKRIVLARRNRMHARAVVDLSDEERDVVWLAAAGHSYKFIAYELGLPIGTVSGRLRRAMKKLRVKSRVELLQQLGVRSANET